MLASTELMNNAQSLRWTSNLAHTSLSPASTAPSPLLELQPDLTIGRNFHLPGHQNSFDSSEFLRANHRDSVRDEDVPYRPSPVQSTVALNKDSTSSNDDAHGAEALHRQNIGNTQWLLRDQYTTRSSVDSRIGITESLSPRSAISNHSGRSLSRGSSESQESSQRSPQRPVLPDFNRSLYPGYDEHGNRRGFEHLHTLSPPQTNGSHYPSRAFNYPPGSTRHNSLSPHTNTHLFEPSTHTPHSPYANPDDRQGAAPEVGHVLSALPGFPDNLNNPTSMPTGPAHSMSLISPFSPDTEHSSKFSSPNEHPYFQPSHSPHTDYSPISTQEQVATKPADVHDAHALLGLPSDTAISLSSLRDPEPGKKPEYPYPVLMKLAIYESPRKALTLQEIYDAFERRFEWFRQHQGWKGTIRHTLSLLNVFQKKPKPITEPGKGQYWYLDFSKEEESRNKRVRKRNKKPSKKQLAKLAAEQDSTDLHSSERLEERFPSDFDDVIDPVLHAESRSARTNGARNFIQVAGRSRVSENNIQDAANRLQAPFQVSRASHFVEGNGNTNQAQQQFHYHSTMMHPQINGMQQSFLTTHASLAGSTELSDSMHAYNNVIRQEIRGTYSPQSTVGPLPTTQTEDGLRFGQSTFRVNPLTPSFISVRPVPRNVRSAPSPFSAFGTTGHVSLVSSDTVPDRNKPIQPPPPKPGTEVVNDGGLPRARRVRRGESSSGTAYNERHR